MAREKPSPGSEAPEPPDGHVGRKAVELGLLTDAQLKDALQQIARADAPETSLSAVLITKGLLSQRQVDTLLEGTGPLKTFGKYRIVRELGRGGMGVVYEAEDGELGRRVALKMLLGSILADPKERALEEERFLREARLSANLPKHPNIVGVHEAGAVEGRRFIAMEFIEGKQFSDWRRGGSITIRQQVTVLRDVTLAVDHAHRHGVIHRDLKPQNILVDARNQPHVTDFGLAKQAGRNAAVSLTASGLVMGTPAYMSPEQAEGRKDVDRRTDLWALGIILYEILTGRLPFQGQTPIEILMKTVKEPVPPPSSVFRGGPPAALDAAIENICLKALAKAPEDRFATARAMADDLTRWLKGDKVSTLRPRKRPNKTWVIGAAAAGILLVLGVAFAFMGPSSSEVAADQAQEFVQQGKRLLKQGKLREAYDAFVRADQVDPGNRAANAGKKEAWEALEAKKTEPKPGGLPPASAPPAPPPPPVSPPPAPVVPAETEEARKRREESQRREAVAKDFGVLDQSLRALQAAEGFGPAYELLDQSEARREDRDWRAGIAERRDDLKKKVAALYEPLREEALAARRRGETPAVESARARVGRWNLPDLAADLEEALRKASAVVSLEAIGAPEGWIELAPLKGHTSGIHTMMFSPDGTQLVSTSFDHTARLWTLPERKTRKTLQDKMLCMAAAISGDGRWVSLGSMDGLVRVWDMAELRVRVFEGHSNQVTGLFFAPDSRLLASSSTDGSARLWDVATGAQKLQVGENPKGAMCVTIAQDGKTMAVGAADPLVQIWQIPSGRHVKTLKSGHEKALSTLAFSPDGRLLASGGNEGKLIVTELDSDRPRVLGLHPQVVRGLAISPDGRWIFSTSPDGILVVWDAARGTPIGAVKDGDGMYSLAVSRKGDLLAGGSGNGTIHLWDIKALKNRK